MTNKNNYLNLLFPLLAFLLYWITKDAKFTSDFYSWIGTYDEQGMGGLANGFGDPGLHPIYHLATFTMYRLFDLNSFPWFVVFVGLHSLNAILIFNVFGRMLQSISIDHSRSIAFVAALFFLLSPYQTETVVWGATIHYLISVGFCLGSIGFFVHYFYRTKKWSEETDENHVHKLKPTAAEIADLNNANPLYDSNRFLLLLGLGSFVCFMLALYALEVALMLPLILVGFLAFIYFWQYSLPKVLKAFSVFVLPQFVGIFLFFLHQKLKLGQWIGHYGASTHLNITPEIIGSTISRYLLKFGTFFRYLPIDGKNKAYYGLGLPQPGWAMFGLVVLLIVVSLVLIFGFRKKKKTKIVLAFFFTFVAALGTVINLETTSLLDIQSDRYGYFASVFFYLLLSSTFFFFFKRVAWTISLFWLILSTFLLINTNKDWKAAGIVTNELIKKYEWFDGRRVYVMNLPDNLKGAYVFRNGFRESLEKHHNRKVEARIIRTIWYNWQDAEDCVPVTVTGPNSAKSGLVDGKKWWIHYGAGANSYDNETQQLIKEGQAYSMIFKEFDPNKDVVIYPCGTEWKQLEMGEK